MTNRSNRWLLVAAALLGVALLVPIVSAHGGLTAIPATDDIAQEPSLDTTPHHGSMVDNRSDVTDSDRPGHGPVGPEHQHGPWPNDTHNDEWTNETRSLHGPVHHGAWVNAADRGERTNGTYGPHDSWADKNRDDDVWTNETDESAPRDGHHRGPGGCR
ncbi:MAG: hypothetical protein V5A34_01075 [Halapricum sp.]